MWQKIRRHLASDWLWWVVVLLVAVLLRAVGLDQQSLRLDEGTTYVRLVLPIDVMVKDLFAVRNQVPLYYLVLRLWSGVAGTSEFALRFPSLFFSVLNVAALYYLGWFSGCRWVGRLAMLLGALNPYDIYFARDARMYGMSYFFITVNMLAFLLVLTRPVRRLYWVVFVVSGTSMYLIHYFTLFIPFVQLVFFWVSFRTTYRRFRRWLMAQAVACVPVVMWILASYWLFRVFGRYRSRVGVPTWFSPLHTFWSFSLGYDGDLTPWVVVGLVAWAVAVVAGAARRSGVSQTWRRLILVWLALPPAVSFVASFVRRPVYVDRYLSICLPAFLVVAAAGVARHRRRWLQVGLTTMLVATTLVSTVGILRGERLAKRDWRTTALYILEHSQAGDRIAVEGSGLYVTLYYVGGALPIERLDDQDLVNSLTGVLSEGGCVWFVYRTSSSTPGLAMWLSDHASDVAGEWQFYEIELVLLDPR